jgi:hypothetical protein
MQTPDIFISYSSKDKLTADKICSFLEANGIRCWITPRDVLPGSNWGESIIDAINDAKVMLLIFSANSNASNHIKREVERAVNRGTPVIPVRIEDVLPSKSLEYFISAQHWLDAYTPPLEKHLQHLATVIKMLLSKIGAEHETVEPGPAFQPHPQVQPEPPAFQVPPAREETITPPPGVAEIKPAAGIPAIGPLGKVKLNVGRALIPLVAAAVLVTVFFLWRSNKPSEPVAMSPPAATSTPQVASSQTAQTAREHAHKGNDLSRKLPLKDELAVVLSCYKKALEHKDKSELRRCYSSNFPELEKKLQEIEANWDGFDFMGMGFSLEIEKGGANNSSPLNNHMGLVKWQFQTRNRKTGEITSHTLANRVSFVQEGGQWRIRAIEKLTNAGN